MRENRTPGSVRGALGNWHPYRDGARGAREPPRQKAPRVWVLCVDGSGKKLQKAAWSGLNLFMWMAAVKYSERRTVAA